MKSSLLNGPVNTPDFFINRDNNFGITFKIDSKDIITNLQVKPLSKIKFDLSKVSISVKNYKNNGIQKISASIENKGESFVFVKV